MVTLGFVAILRLGDLVVRSVEDVTFVLKNGNEVNVSKLTRVPRLDEVKGVFFIASGVKQTNLTVPLYQWRARLQ